MPLAKSALHLISARLQGLQPTDERVQGIWWAANPGWGYHLQAARHKGECSIICPATFCVKAADLASCEFIPERAVGSVFYACLLRLGWPLSAVACGKWRGHGQGFHALCKTAWHRGVPAVKVHPEGELFLLASLQFCSHNIWRGWRHSTLYKRHSGGLACVCILASHSAACLSPVQTFY